METFSAELAICAGNSPIPGEFLAQRPVTRSFDVFFDPRLNKRSSKYNREAGDMRRHHVLYDVSVMISQHFTGSCNGFVPISETVPTRSMPLCSITWPQ